MNYFGFTGTQKGMTDEQRDTLDTLMREMAGKPPSGVMFNHGDCVGADVEAATLARKLGFYVVGHPSNLHHKRGHFPSDYERTPKTPLVRNRSIVYESDVLFACPRGTKPQRRSGTWFTINFARTQSVPVYIIHPNGEYEQ